MDQIKLVNILEEKTKKRLETLRELPILLTEKEVAQYFEISSSILAQWRIQGEGPSYHKLVGAFVMDWLTSLTTLNPANVTQHQNKRSEKNNDNAGDAVNWRFKMTPLEG